DASPGWLYPLAMFFGALNGLAFGETLAAGRPFAGAHAWAAGLTFLLAVAGGQLWLAGVMSATWRWLARMGLSERIGAIVVSAFVAHSALHRVAERGQALAESGSPAGDRALVWLTIAWAGVMVVVAAIDALRRARPHDAADRLEDAAHTS